MHSTVVYFPIKHTIFFSTNIFGEIILEIHNFSLCQFLNDMNDW